MAQDDLVLPWLQDDQAFVLATWAVLREQARPVLPRHRGDDAPRNASGVWPSAGLYSLHQDRDVLVQVDVGLVVVDVEVPNPTVPRRHVAIAQVPTEELRVAGTIQRRAVTAWAGDGRVRLTPR